MYKNRTREGKTGREDEDVMETNRNYFSSTFRPH